MRYNFWRHLRLAGGLLGIVGAFIKNGYLVVIGFMLVAVGTVNGLYRVEQILETLLKENEDESKSDSQS